MFLFPFFQFFPCLVEFLKIIVVFGIVFSPVCTAVEFFRLAEFINTQDQTPDFDITGLDVYHATGRMSGHTFDVGLFHTVAGDPQGLAQLELFRKKIRPLREIEGGVFLLIRPGQCLKNRFRVVFPVVAISTESRNIDGRAGPGVGRTNFQIFRGKRAPGRAVHRRPAVAAPMAVVGPDLVGTR